MKIVSVGAGRLSNAFKRHCDESGVSNVVFPLSRVSGQEDQFESLVEEIAGAEAILFLGYDYHSVPANIRFLSGLLAKLQEMRWMGVFVFFNTQLALQGVFDRVAGGKPMGRRDFPLDPYVVTKKLQSRLISRHAARAHFSFVDAYLPVVMGVGTKATERYGFIASHGVITLPNAGRNKVAVCDLDQMTAYVVRRLKEHQAERVSGKPGSFKGRVFLLSRLTTHAELVSESFMTLCRSRMPAIQAASDRLYAPSMSAELVFSIKRSVLWTGLQLAKSLARPGRTPARQQAPTMTLKNGQSTDVFEPIGFEREFMASTMAPERMNIERIIVQ